MTETRRSGRRPGASNRKGEGMADTGRTAPQRDLAPALTRGLRILDIVATAGRPVTMTQIAGELGIAKSSVHGLLATLVAAGFLERLPGGGYRLGLRLVDLANARLESLDLPAEFYAVWDRLGDFRQEAAVLAMLDGPDVLYIACRNSTLPLGVTFRIGMRLPACCTATGKALLSTFTDEEVRAFYDTHELARPTQASVSDVESLLGQLRVIRARGYSIDDGETRDHMWSVGAPIRAYDSGRAEAAVAVSFLRSDVTEAKAAKAAAFVRTFASELSQSRNAPKA